MCFMVNFELIHLHGAEAFYAFCFNFFLSNILYFLLILIYRGRMTGTYDVNLDGAITGVVRLVECRIRDIGDSLWEQAVWFVRFRDA